MKRTWRYKVRALRIDGDIAYIPLTRDREAVIDVADVPLVEGWNWCAFPSADERLWYAYSGGNRKIRLHQLLLPAPPGFMVDHKDSDGLNCRRSNLRLVTAKGNAQNRRRRREGISKFKGVSPHGSNWRARIVVDGHRVQLGTFESEQDAARAYEQAAAEATKFDSPYDPTDDFVKSLDLGFAAIRERVAAGGPTWSPKDPTE